MTERVEAEGTTIDEAIDRALAELGVPREQARVEILHDAKRGLLGIGGQPARVAVSLRSAEPNNRSAEPRNRSAEAPTNEEGGARPKPSPVASGDPPGPEAVLTDILVRMGVTASVQSVRGSDQDGDPILEIESESSALLIGRHGQTLDALEYLVNRIVAKREERGTRVGVDCQGYRERHREGLRQTALRMAEKVRQRGRSQTMVPMSPRDRRIVHLTLAEAGDVATKSVGEGFLRRVVISSARREPSRSR